MSRGGAHCDRVNVLPTYIYIYIYINGMVVSRGNYPLVICYIAIENGP